MIITTVKNTAVSKKNSLIKESSNIEQKVLSIDSTKDSRKSESLIAIFVIIWKLALGMVSKIFSMLYVYITSLLEFDYNKDSNC